MQTTVDPLKELKKSPQTPLKIAQDDPELQKEVEDFISASTENAPPKEDPAHPRVKLAPDTSGLEPTPADSLLTEALVNTQDLEISDIEKDLFVKALLCDTPLEMDVFLYNKKFKYRLRARTHYEQKRIYEIVELDRKEKVIELMDIAGIVTRTQQYAATLMVKVINDSVFSQVQLVPGKKVEEDAKEMRDFVAASLDKISIPQWVTIINAMRIFETKCAKLNEMAANDDFWLPRATG